MTKDEINLKNRPILRYFRGTPYGRLTKKQFADWFEGFEKKLRNMNFYEWIQENQEELPLGYSKAQILELFVKKEILG